MLNGAVERTGVGCAEEAFAALGAFPTLSAGLLGVLDGVGTDAAAARTGWRHGFTVGRCGGLRGVVSCRFDLRVILAVCGSSTAAHRLGPKRADFRPEVGFRPSNDGPGSESARNAVRWLLGSVRSAREMLWLSSIGDVREPICRHDVRKCAVEPQWDDYRRAARTGASHLARSA